jgi:hypothetical protein
MVAVYKYMAKISTTTASISIQMALAKALELGHCFHGQPRPQVSI